MAGRNKKKVGKIDPGIAKELLKRKRAKRLGLAQDNTRYRPIKLTAKLGNSIPITIPELLRLGALQCTLLEICAYFGCTVDELSEEHVRAVETSREAGKIKLRELMLDCAMRGSHAMQIWLSKNWLGWADSGGGDVKINVQLNDLPEQPIDVSARMTAKDERAIAPLIERAERGDK